MRVLTNEQMQRVDADTIENVCPGLELMERAELSWPDPTHYRPGATQEEIERSRRRRLADAREAFLAQGFARSAQRAVGIVPGWGSDYPDPGSPLWEECGLEGVGAGILGKLVFECIEVLRRDKDAVGAAIEELMGDEMAQLHQVLGEGVSSITEANRAVASALRAIDVVIPEAAWKHVHTQLPRARGEWDG